MQLIEDRLTRVFVVPAVLDREAVQEVGHRHVARGMLSTPALTRSSVIRRLRSTR